LTLQQHNGTSCNRPFFYRRYIDDIFILWTDTTEKLNNLICEINSSHPTIKVTTEISTKSVNYLDFTISSNNNNLQITTYFNPTNTFSYLPRDSHHSKAIKQGIYKGEIIRMLRNNSELSTYNEQADLLKRKFTDRKYNSAIVEQQIPDFS